MAKDANQNRHTRGALRAVAKGLSLLLLVVVAAAAAMLAWLNSEPGEAWARKLAVEQIRAARAPGLSVGTLDGFLPFSFVAKAVVLDDIDGDAAVKVERLDANLHLWSLLQGTIRFKSLHLHNPTVRVTRDAQGDLNIAELLKPRAPRWSFVFEKVTVDAGRAVVMPERQPATRINALKLTARGSLRERRPQFWIHRLAFDYVLGPRRGRVLARGQLQHTETRIDARARAQVTGLRPEPLPISLTAAGPTDAIDADLRIGAAPAPLVELAATVDAGAFAYSLRGHVQGLDPQVFVPRLPSGNVSLTLAVAGSGIPLTRGSHLRANLTSPGSRLAAIRIDTLEAALSTRGQRWALTTLRAQSSSLQLTASGSGNLDTFQLDAHLHAKDFGPLAVEGRMLRLTARASLHAEPTNAETVRIAGTARIGELDYGELRLAGFATHIDGRLDMPERRGEVNLTSNTPFVLNTVTVHRAKARVQTTSEQLHITGETTLATRTGKPLQPARVFARLPLQNGRLAIAAAAPWHLGLTWANGSLALLGRLAGVQQPPSGQLWLDVDVKGSRQAPSWRARARLRRGTLGPLQALRAHLAVDAGPRSSVVSTRVLQKGSQLAELRATTRVSPSVLLQRASQWQTLPFTLQAEIDRRPVAFWRQLVPQLPRIGGSIGGSLSLQGPAKDAQLMLRTLLVQDAGERMRPLRLRTQLRAESSEAKTRARLCARINGRSTLEAAASADMSALQALTAPMRLAATFRTEGRIDALAIALLGRVYAPLRSWSGRISAHWAFAGPLPKLRGQATVETAGLAAGERYLGDVALSLSTRESLARLDAKVDQPTGSATVTARFDAAGEGRILWRAKDLDVAPLLQWTEASLLAEPTVSGLLLAQLHVHASAAEQHRGVTSGTMGSLPGPVAALMNPELLTATVQVAGGDVSIYLATAAGAGERPTAKPRRLDEILRRMLPFHLQRLEVTDSRVQLVDATLPNRPRLVVRDLALTVENVASRRPLMDEAPAVLTLAGTLEATGELWAFATFDPLTQRPAAAGHAALYDMQLSAFNPFLAPVFDIQATRGHFTCWAAFRIAGGQVSGGIKPFIRNVQLAPAPGASPLEGLSAEAAEELAELFADETATPETLATIVPIAGTLTDPHAQVVPTVLGVIRNAFVVGLVDGFAHLPPETARFERSLFAQAADALTGPTPPKAEPDQLGLSPGRSEQ